MHSVNKYLRESKGYSEDKQVWKVNKMKKDHMSSVNNQLSYSERYSEVKQFWKANKMQTRP